MAASALGYLHIANGAHAAGFLFGLVTGWAIYARRRRKLAVIMIPALIAMVVLSLTWMPWSRPWTLWKATTLFRDQQWNAASIHFRQSLRLGADPLVVWPLIYVAESRQGHLEAAREAKSRTTEAFAARMQEVANRRRNR